MAELPIGHIKSQSWIIPHLNFLAAGAEIQMLGDRNVPSSNLVFCTTGTSRYDTYDISQKKSYRFIEEEHMEMLQAEGK